MLSYFLILGQHAEFFCLEKYKTEVGKDYKRIIFYLCLKKDLEQSEDLEKYEETDDEKSDDNFNLNLLFNGDLPPEEMFQIDDFIDAVEKAETESQKEKSSSNEQTESNEISCNLPQDAIVDAISDSGIDDYKDVVNLLRSKVKHDGGSTLSYYETTCSVFSST